jgi:UDP-glucose 4-epimerase
MVLSFQKYLFADKNRSKQITYTTMYCILSMSSVIDECCPSCPKTFENEKILIFGGSGSLGKTVIRRWIENNEIINVSRDEEKQWSLKNHVKSSKLSQIIGDISNQKDVDNAILTTKPSIICIFACLKHIDLCEKFPEKAMQINSVGILNVERTLKKYETLLKIHTVLFVSTDKACATMTTYGCTKAISEYFVQNVKTSPATKWVAVRYGNVLNSSGSILPYLHSAKQSPEPFTLTHKDMTRFIMTLEQSVNLIEYAICEGKTNEIIIPHLMSIRIQDLFAIFESLYDKQTVITGLRCKEKIHEDLLTNSEAQCTYSSPNEKYYHITNKVLFDSKIKPFDSSTYILPIDILQEYLKKKGLL